jgi:hypothetical protein
MCTFGNFCFDLVFNLLKIKLFLFTYLQKACIYIFYFYLPLSCVERLFVCYCFGVVNSFNYI